tara:strand:- start:6940 stop:7335 length:396 start_codon:yes stop_codon:yes gene_type:complete
MADPQTMKPLADEATTLLKALSHPARLMICCQLRHGEMAVGELETTLDIKQPNLSRELAKLREDGLLETRRESKVIFYRLSDASRLARMVDAICAVMLDKQLPTSPKIPQERPEFRPSTTGSYGVFARTRI